MLATTVVLYYHISCGFLYFHHLGLMCNKTANGVWFWLPQDWTHWILQGLNNRFQKWGHTVDNTGSWSMIKGFFWTLWWKALRLWRQSTFLRVTFIQASRDKILGRRPRVAFTHTTTHNRIHGEACRLQISVKNVIIVILLLFANLNESNLHFLWSIFGGLTFFSEWMAHRWVHFRQESIKITTFLHTRATRHLVPVPTQTSAATSVSDFIHF